MCEISDRFYSGSGTPERLEKKGRLRIISKNGKIWASLVFSLSFPLLIETLCLWMHIPIVLEVGIKKFDSAVPINSKNSSRFKR